MVSKSITFHQLNGPKDANAWTGPKDANAWLEFGKDGLRPFQIAKAGKISLEWTEAEIRLGLIHALWLMIMNPSYPKFNGK